MAEHRNYNMEHDFIIKTNYKSYISQLTVTNYIACTDLSPSVPAMVLYDDLEKVAEFLAQVKHVLIKQCMKIFGVH